MGCDPFGVVNALLLLNALRATSCDPSGVKNCVVCVMTPEGSKLVEKE